MHASKIVRTFPLNNHLQNILHKELGISRILAQVLINRGITNPDEAEKFLHTDLDNLNDPYSFSDMQTAVNIIGNKVRNKDKIMIFGDYDVDGITSVALLKTTLSKMGVSALHYLPHRIKEGYGLSKNILHIAKEKNIKLLITVDCGTSSHRQIEELRSVNIDVIVTDHHEPLGSELPPASAIINPKIKGSSYKYRELAGVGVVYKLCQALSRDKLVDELDLVSLGTIADVVPLTGENRVIAKIGLSELSQTRKAGLKALIENSGIKNRKLTSTSISYILGPRINASGRMATGEAALKLLLTKEKSEADELANLLESYNRQRQKIEGKIMEEAFSLIEREINFKEHKIIVIANEGWHQGVLGIVASKLADKFYRPTIVISLADGLCRGSGRSIKNFHLFHALLECKEFLDTFGGHSHAVGLNITRDNVEGFKNKLNQLAKEKLRLEDLLPCLEIDLELGLSDLDEALVAELQMLEPFGTGNPEPLFYTRNLKLKGQPQLLARDTIKFWVTDGKTTHQAIGFGKSALGDSLVDADTFDLAYTPRIDSWQDNNSVILEVKEIFSK